MTSDPNIIAEMARLDKEYLKLQGAAEELEALVDMLDGPDSEVV